MLWTDKYRPQTLDEVVGNNKEKKIIQDWVDNWKTGNPQKPLLLVGPPGIGKTTLAQIIAKENFQNTLSSMQVINVHMMLLKVQLENHHLQDPFSEMNTN